MASAEHPYTDEKQFMCAICRDNYTIPRYLPTCGHTFCEKCLFHFITNVKERGELGGQFQCPECKLPHNSPENGEVTLEWIQTLPVNTVIVKLMDLHLPSVNRLKEKETLKMCEPCGRRGERNVGEHYCLDCKEVMCEGCRNFHKSFKVIAYHTTAEIKTLFAESVPEDFLANLMKCPEHPDRELDFYTKEDDELLCGVCVHTSDKTYKNTVTLSCLDIDSDQVKEDAQELKKQLESALEHMQLLQELRKQNKDDLKLKLKRVKDEIEKVKVQVVHLMENVVQHVANVAKAIEIEVETKSDEDATRVLDMMKTCKQDACVLDTINQHGSDRHRFLCTKLIRNCLEYSEIHISEEDECLKTFEVALKLSDDLTKLTDNADLHTLVEMDMTECESDHKFHEAATNVMKDKMLVKTEERTVRTMTSRDPVYYGITVSKDGKIFLCDVNTKYLCMYNASDDSLVKITMNAPFSAVSIANNLVAVSVPGDKAIYTVSVTEGSAMQIEKTMNTQYVPESLVLLKNGQLAVSWHDPPAFGIIDISGTEVVQQTYFVQDTAGRKFRSFEYLAVDERRGHVIQSCAVDKAVHCFGLAGKHVFKYTDPGLVNPRGVALDKWGNIYVCARDDHSVHKLSPDGGKISIFREGIPREPHAICCNKSDGTVWITQCTSGHYDKLHVYKLA